MYQNPILLQALARDHVAELREGAQAAALSRRENRQRRVIEAARSGAGWGLVELGLRLALPRGAVHHPVPRG